MKRYGELIKIRPEKFEEYKRLHSNVWPEILQTLHECNFRNYTIFHAGEFLFGYYEYVGDDYAADTARIGASECTQKWWELTIPCQIPLETRAEGDWWEQMEELFHMD